MKDIKRHIKELSVLLYVIMILWFVLFLKKLYLTGKYIKILTNEIMRNLGFASK